MGFAVELFVRSSFTPPTATAVELRAINGAEKHKTDFQKVCFVAAVAVGSSNLECKHRQREGSIWLRRQSDSLELQILLRTQKLVPGEARPYAKVG